MSTPELRSNPIYLWLWALSVNIYSTGGWDGPKIPREMHGGQSSEAGIPMDEGGFLETDGGWTDTGMGRAGREGSIREERRDGGWDKVIAARRDVWSWGDSDLGI